MTCIITLSNWYHFIHQERFCPYLHDQNNKYPFLRIYKLHDIITNITYCYNVVVYQIFHIFEFALVKS